MVLIFLLSQIKSVLWSSFTDSITLQLSPDVQMRARRCSSVMLCRLSDQKPRYAGKDYHNDDGIASARETFKIPQKRTKKIVQCLMVPVNVISKSLQEI